VNSQEPITTGDSEPEPDATVVRGRLRDYGPDERVPVVTDDVVVATLLVAELLP
jgi:hypothetical protein